MLRPQQTVISDRSRPLIGNALKEDVETIKIRQFCTHPGTYVVKKSNKFLYSANLATSFFTAERLTDDPSTTTRSESRR